MKWYTYKIGSCRVGQGGPVAPTLNDDDEVGKCFFRYVTILVFDRQTDGQTGGQTDISFIAKTAAQ